MAIRAIIFDLDGTLADTEPLHFEAFNAVLRPYGIEVSRTEYFNRLIGYDDHDCFATLLREHGKPADPAVIRDLIALKTGVYQATIAGRQVLFPGAMDFVRYCARRFPLALVTGTLRAEAEMILQKAQLRNLFVDIVTAEEIGQGKPAPDGFEAALGHLAFLLRVRPPIVAAECLVIEDTAAGVEAARRAGMHVLAVEHTVSASELKFADLIRPSLAETDLDEVLYLLQALS
jgi:HAD superfamily hydrolase (TIGR01509 family)